MSYDIVYAREFIKTSDGRIVPLVLCGSNNTWETTYSGTWRRERHWYPICVGEGNNPAVTPEVLMEQVKSSVPSNNNEHFVRNGKWVDDAGYVRFFENGIKKSKTLEELNDELLFTVHLNCLVYYYVEDYNERNLHISTVKNSVDLDVFLKKVDELIAEYSGKEKLYVSIEFECSDTLKRKKKIRERKERLKDFYVITTVNGYVSKLTRRTLYSTQCAQCAKQFESKEKALKWLKKYDVERRFRRLTFGVEYVA